MTKHILCAVDLTHDGDARAILVESGRLADFYGARLSVITVLPDYGSSWVGTFFKEGAMKEAAQAASDALHEMVAGVLPERQDVRHIVDIGSAYEKVLEVVEKIGADMVVVGAHRPDFKDRILGPNAARIVRNARVSVLVIRLG
ncbi:MAG: universal stress protein [Hyphomicrobiales bacterium]|nr:universal stress protein [Hyphomicrobiales bacterium]MCY4049135.1 universal stress protein [Hyphomicrobiales bacterium]MCY4053690.1 universal stress protein [Hyphomicrobiales bacterium]